jgi:hypothetical protein
MSRRYPLRKQAAAGGVLVASGVTTGIDNRWWVGATSASQDIHVTNLAQH